MRQLGRGKYESSDNCRVRKSNSSEKLESRVVLWRRKAPNDVFHSEVMEHYVASCAGPREKNITAMR